MRKKWILLVILITVFVCVGCTSLKVEEPIENAFAIDSFGYRWAVVGLTQDHRSLAGVRPEKVDVTGKHIEYIPMKIVKVELENYEKIRQSRILDPKKIFLKFYSPVSKDLRNSDLFYCIEENDNDIIVVTPTTFTALGMSMRPSVAGRGNVLSSYTFGIGYPVIEGWELVSVIVQDEIEIFISDLTL